MMGAGLAKAAYSAAARVGADHAPARVFVFMALTPLDADPAPAYFGGREALATAIGADATTKGFRAVDRAMSALSKHGLIKLSRKGAPGRNTRYLILDGAGAALSVNTPRSASGDSETHHAERRVNNSEHTTLSGRTHHAQRSEHTTLSVDLRSKEEIEEETRASAPTRTCLRHPNWEHSERCRACGEDRRRAEAASAARRPATMSEQRGICAPGKHRWLSDGTCMLCEDKDDPLADIA